jgi:hypothetical protein
MRSRKKEMTTKETMWLRQRISSTAEAPLLANANRFL